MFSIIRSALLLDSWYHSSHKGGNSANGIPAHVQEERSTATQTGENFTWSDHSEVTKIGAGMNVVFLWFQLNLDYLLFFSSSDLVTTLVILQWATCILGGKDFISIKIRVLHTQQRPQQKTWGQAQWLGKDECDGYHMISQDTTPGNSKENVIGTIWGGESRNQENMSLWCQCDPLQTQDFCILRSYRST